MHFGFALDLSYIDLLNIDLLHERYTHLDLLDTDIPSKHFVCLLNVLKTSSRHVFKTSSRYVFKTSSRHVFKTSSRRLARCLLDVFATGLQNVLKTFLRRVGRLKIVTLKTYWRRLEDQQTFAGVGVKW